eukprot:CAMPEP_0180253438 /NCGR_PEP_ID=MMETSP0987-20121128/39605_1 /TAXON_ID=697907 /ORGANISM="non described non described, Strain CCMP2293" /LENGTH=372 /DNA_ID=CAMNT_0022222315 /DNA_START=1 /DNA_END=1118 /DNA_ORIENTATION=-
MKDKDMQKDLQKQLDVLKKRQAEALAQMQEAAAALSIREGERNKARDDLSSTLVEKERVGAEADIAVRAVAEAVEGKELAKGLLDRGFGYVDDFLGEPMASYVRDELRIMERDGTLHKSELAGGKNGTNMRYTMEEVRGDVVRWVSGKEEGCHNIGLLKEIKDQVVLAVKDKVAELSGEDIQRGNLMCTCYPGGTKKGAECGQGGPCRYVRHCDNPNSNGRRLTAIYYLNKGWEPSHGGCLRVYPSDSEGNEIGGHVDIEPRHDRLLLFFSDKRVPHEVLDAACPAVRDHDSTWYYSATERAQAEAVAGDEEAIEAARITVEIERFKGKTGSAPSNVCQPDSKQEYVATVRDTPIPGIVHPNAATMDLEELD